MKSDEELGRLLDRLANEMVDTAVYWRLHCNVQLATATFGREAAQARAFWGTAQQALLDAAVFRLCKVYDDYPGALNLGNVLETIQANPGYFSEASFRRRMAGNPHVDSLASESRVPEASQLDADLDFVRPASNPVVRLLKDARNNLFAHHSAKDTITQVDLAVKYPLTKEQVGSLISGGTQIINRYTYLFGASTYSTKMVGEDDFRNVFEAIRWDLARRDDEIRREEIRLDLYRAWDAVAERQDGDA